MVLRISHNSRWILNQNVVIIECNLAHVRFHHNNIYKFGLWDIFKNCYPFMSVFLLMLFRWKGVTGRFFILVCYALLNKSFVFLRFILHFSHSHSSRFILRRNLLIINFFDQQPDSVKLSVTLATPLLQIQTSFVLHIKDTTKINIKGK